jgi:hypothetical protein
MNHISKSYSSSDGRVFKGDSWELREGGFRRTALFLGNGLWPASKEARLIRFLLDRGFRVLSPELAFGAHAATRMGLKAFRSAVSAFAEAEATVGLPLYILASGCSAGAFLPVASTLPDLASVILIAPIVDFPPPGSKRPLLFLPSFELPFLPAALSGEPELLEDLLPEKAALRFSRRDLRAAASELGTALAAPFDRPLASFSGEADPFLLPEGRAALERGGAKIYGYPRVRHEPGHDRYADNFYADLGSFLDEVEAAGKKKRA